VTEQSPIAALGNAIACGNCRWFAMPAPHEADLIKKGVGECHRYPPTTDYVFLGIDEKADPPEPRFSRMIHNTNVALSNFCGEFSRKPLAKGQLPPRRGS
jgi:hypothetical protein